MRGQGSIRFSELFSDNVATHGIAWTVAYMQQHGMELWEVLIWARPHMRG